MSDIPELSKGQREVQMLLRGSRTLNRAKDDINTFLAMFVGPFGKIAVERWGACIQLFSITVRPRLAPHNPAFIVFSTNRHEILISVTQKKRATFDVDKGANHIPRHLVLPFWEHLFAMLLQLRAAIPEIEKDIELYQDAAEFSRDFGI